MTNEIKNNLLKKYNIQGVLGAFRLSRWFTPTPANVIINQ